MSREEIENQLARLNFEDFVWLFYSSIIITNVLGNYYEKNFLTTNSKMDEIKFNTIFEIVLILNSLIYVYLLIRNYNNYQRASIEEKNIYLVRVVGMILMLIGISCLIYYQDYQTQKARFR